MSSKKPKDEEKFQITSEEVEQLKKALQKDEFRKLLVEYAKEISDPENRKRYEEEIAQLERDRGQEVKFLHPEPGFVIKAKLADSKKKVFINICMSENIAAPSALPTQSSGKLGQNWSIPYSMSPGREDVDKAGVRCTVYDVIFNPQSFKECDKDPRFRQLLISTALEGLEKQFKLKVEKRALKFPKMEYKGTPKSTVLRKPHPDGPLPPEQQPGLEFPYPNDPVKKVHSEKKAKVKKSKPKNEPSYTVTHRGEVDMGDFTNSRISSAVKRPKCLVVRVDLPGVKSVSSVDLEVFERKLELAVENPRYVLNLPLHYDVDQDNTTAQFDKSTETLTVTIPVLPSSSSFPSGKDVSSPPTPPSTQPPTNGDVLSPPTPPSPPGPTSEDRMRQEGTKDVPTLEPSADAVGEETGERKEEEESYPPLSLPSSLPLLPSVQWVCPPFRYRQTKEHLVFVFDVTNVTSGSVVSHFDQHWAQVTFAAGFDGQSYSFYVNVKNNAEFRPELCKVDVSPENVVLLLGKAEESLHMWPSFEAGKSAEDKKKKLFATRTNGDECLRSLDEQDMWLKGSDSTELTVSSCVTNNGVLTMDVVCTDECGGSQLPIGTDCHPVQDTVNQVSTSEHLPATPVDIDQESNNISSHPHNHAVGEISGEDTPGVDIAGVTSTGVDSSGVNPFSGDTLGVNSSHDGPDSNCTPDLDSPHSSDLLRSCTTPVGEGQHDTVENSCNTTELHQNDIVQESVVVEQQHNGIVQGFVGIEQPQSPIEQQLDNCNDYYATYLHPIGKVGQKASALDQQEEEVEESTPEGEEPQVGAPPQGNPPSSTLLLGNTYLYDLD